MTAVSNTSPINYLVLIGLAEILPEMFSQVLIPIAERWTLIRAVSTAANPKQSLWPSNTP